MQRRIPDQGAARHMKHLTIADLARVRNAARISLIHRLGLFMGHESMQGAVYHLLHHHAAMRLMGRIQSEKFEMPVFGIQLRNEHRQFEPVNLSAQDRSIIVSEHERFLSFAVIPSHWSQSIING